jgi:cellobiose phosphorylase
VECRIDSLAQSWAVLSGAGDAGRSEVAMNALDDRLVSREDKLIKLLTPPFDESNPSPGYIQGYVQGVRENGGQYTHAAVWAAMAFAAQGDARRAWDLFDILNPIRHAETAQDVAKYMTEPYVVASDVYSTTGHVGRGGWTWYTGSAGWLYRVSLEWLLGFRVQGDGLVLDPCIPRNWPRFEIAYRHGATRYDIVVENPLGVCRGILTTKLDGKVLTVEQTKPIALLDDGGAHRLEVVLG